MNPYTPPDVRPSSQNHRNNHHHHHLHHQQTRYAQASSPARPSNRPNFSDNSHLYAPQTLHHHHHHQHYQQSRHIPAPYQPPPAQPRPLTSPQPQYEFASRGFNPTDDNHDRRSIYHHHQHQRHALVDGDRRVVVGHDSPVVENRAELLDLRQTVTDNLVHRAYSSAGLNLDVRRRPAATPYAKVDSSMRETEPISRVRIRDDYAEFRFDQQDDLFRGSSRRYAAASGSYDNVPHRNERGDNGRFSWVLRGENTRKFGDSFPESTDYVDNDGDDSGTVALKPEYHGTEFLRCSSVNRGNREVAREYSLTPRRQLQKKSAFLRLQMPRFNGRGRDNERHYISNNYHDGDTSGSLSSKGKWQGQSIYADHGQKDRRANGSVDLDVSFKSNTLIAKPIVPPSSSRVVLEKDSMLLSKKLKSAIVSDRDSTNSLQNKVNENDKKFDSSPSEICAAVSTSSNSKKLHERVIVSDAQHKSNLGHLEGMIIESDAPVKSDGNPTPVPKVTGVSFTISEVGKANLSSGIDKSSADLQSRKDAVTEGQNSKTGAETDIVFDKAGKNVGSSPVKTADKGLPDKAPPVKDAVPEGQDSNDGPQKNVVSDKYGKIVDPGQDKHAEKGLAGNAHSVKDATPVGQDYNAGPKKDVVFDKAGRSVGSSPGRTVDKVLTVRAPSVKDVVPEGQDSNAGPKRDVISDKYAKSVGRSQSKSAEKGLPGKARSVKGAAVDSQYANTGPKRDAVSDKDGKKVGPGQGKTADKALPGKAHSVKGIVPEGQDSNAGPKRDVVSDKDGKRVGSGQGRTVEKRLRGEAHSVKDIIPAEQDSNVGPKRNFGSDKDGKDVGSSQGKTAAQGLPGKVHSVKDAVPEDQDSNAGTKRDVVSDKDGKNGGSNQSRTADGGLPDTAPSVKVAKKKKIVKKIVKKVVTRRTEPPKQQPSSKHDEPMKAGSPAASASCKGSGSSKEQVVSSTDVTHDSNEAGLLQKIDQVKGASHSISSQRCGRDTDEGTNVLGDKKDRDCSSSSLCPILRESKAEAPNANNDVYGLHIVSSSIKDLTVPCAQADGKISKVSGQLHQDLKCLPVENQAQKDNLPEDSSTKRPSDSGAVIVQDGCTVVDGSWLRANASACPEEALVGSQDLTICSGKGSIDSAECNGHDYQSTTVLPEDPQSIIKTGACWVPGSSSTNSVENLTELSNVLSNDASGQLPQVGDPGKHDDGSKRNLENIGSTVEDSRECADNAGRCHDVISQVDHVSSREADICKKPMDITCSDPSRIVGTVLSLSVQNADPALDSGLGGLSLGLPAITYGHTASQGRGSAVAYLPSDTNVSVNGGSDVGEGRTSPASRKRRKVCSPYRGPSDARTHQDSYITFVADRTTSVSLVKTTSCDRSIQEEVGVPVPSSDALQVAASVPTQEEGGVLLKDTRQVGEFNAMGSARNGQLPATHSTSFLGQSDTGNGESLKCLIIEGCPEENFPAVSSVHDHQNQERVGDRKLELDPSEKQVMGNSERSNFFIPGIGYQISDRKFSPSYTANDASLNLKDDSPSVLPYLSFSGDVDGVYASNSNDEVMEPVSDTLSPESLHNVSGAEILSGRASRSQLTNESVVRRGTDREEYLVGRGFSLSADSVLTSVSPDNLVDYSSDHAVETSCAARSKTVIFPSNASQIVNSNPNPSPSGEPFGRMNRQSRVIQRAFPGHSSFSSTYSKITTSKPNTWRRTNSTSAAPPGHKPSVSTLPAKRPLPGKNEKLQNTSYIRKGNSLVRKPVVAASPNQFSHGTVPVYRINSSDMHDLEKSIVSGNADDVNGMLNNLMTGGRNVPLTRPQTPLQSGCDDLPNTNTVHSACLQSFRAANSQVAVFGDPVSDPTGSTETETDEFKTREDVRMTSEIHQDQTVSINNSGSQNEMEGESMMASNLKRITYVKRKSNQLVATVSDSDLSVPMADKTQQWLSKGYYKRMRNQLIRTPLHSVKQSFSDNANTEGRQGAKVTSGATCSSRGSLKVAAKLRTPVKSALVWTLGDFNTSNCRRVFPQLPWKRVSHWRNFMRNSASIGDNRSLSAISRKLMLSRKRDTVYVRSSHGLSLRKSKVVSVGGCSLKWSKSIERQSKKASEEATRAVVAAEKERRELNYDPSFGSMSKNKRRSLRERIFRIGNVRYKMDASRKTLIRISDDESSLSTGSQQGTDAKKSYVPRRLVIGNDEYVRIGNGNQLIRDPKKRTRVLASEKVKWSLHTARLKLAKKRIYCQFFTRFGKCNKSDGKCPYMHDPSKIAVCTKFLSGSCSNEDCKLTHKVIPERMPDCSYFLQGLCSNRDCPYRHVNVNPNSSTCEGFLRGYCADGNECRKKHSYVCQIFESTGNCPLGLKCKLHHPKSRTRGKKRKRSKGKKNAMGRYFGGSTHVRAAVPATSVTEKVNNRIENPFKGEFDDYISLDVCYEDEECAEKIGHLMGDDANEELDMELDDVNELIKPIALMNSMA